jgi:hypothetical protein
VERLDLLVPSLERLGLAAMKATHRAAMGRPHDRVVLFRLPPRTREPRPPMEGFLAYLFGERGRADERTGSASRPVHPATS